jgi:hypothetical protein
MLTPLSVSLTPGSYTCLGKAHAVPGLNTPHRRENTVLRANLDPRTVYVIPNAVIAEQFEPRTSLLPTDTSEQIIWLGLAP